MFNKLDEPRGPTIPYPSDVNRRPLQIFSFKNGIAKINDENAKLLALAGLPLGGNATVRRHIIKDEDGNDIVDPDYIHTNSGATINGEIDRTRVLGNFGIKRHCNLDSEPSIFTGKLDGDGYFVIGTDGFFNLWRFEDIAPLLKNNNSRGSLDLLYNATMEHAAQENYKLINQSPYWDDITYAIIKVSDKITNFRNDYVRRTKNGVKITKNPHHKNPKKQKKNGTIKTEGRRRRKKRKLQRERKKFK